MPTSERGGLKSNFSKVSCSFFRHQSKILRHLGVNEAYLSNWTSPTHNYSGVMSKWQI